MKINTLIKKLGIEEEVNSILENCECGKVNSIKIERLSKMKKEELQDYVGNFLDSDLYGDKFCLERRTMKTFCKEFGIKESELSDYYAQSISEGGYEMAYAINEDIILIVE